MTFKTTHLIEEYSIKNDSILCVCGWKGSTKKFPKHQEISPPTASVPSPDRYPGEVFNGSIEDERGITREVKNRNPDLFDYVDSKHRERVPEIFIPALPETEEF